MWTRTGAEYIGYADSSPAIYGQQVFVNGNSRLQALSLSTGALQWTSVAGGYGESSPVLGPSGQWLVVGGYGGLYKVNTANGAVAWTFVPSFTPPAYSSPSIHTSPALSADFSTAYLTVTPNVTWSGGGGGSGIALYAIDTSTGAQRWAYRTSNPGDGETYSSPTVLDNGDIVFSTTSTVYCVTGDYYHDRNVLAGSNALFNHRLPTYSIYFTILQYSLHSLCSLWRPAVGLHVLRLGVRRHGGRQHHPEPRGGPSG